MSSEFARLVLTETIRQIRRIDRVHTIVPSSGYAARGAVPVRWWLEGEAVCIVFEQPPMAGLNGVRHELRMLPPWSDEMTELSPTAELTRGLPRDFAAVEQWALALSTPVTEPFNAPQSRDDVDAGLIVWRGDVRPGLPRYLSPSDESPLLD